MPSKTDGEYSRPTVEVCGSVESITQQYDKIGGYEDGVNYAQLDGSIVPDS